MTFDEWWDQHARRNAWTERDKRFAKAAWEAAKQDMAKMTEAEERAQYTPRRIGADEFAKRQF